MSENIYEIAQMIQNRQNFNSEMTEVMELIQNHFMNKYMKRLNRVAQSHHQKIKDSPPKEVRLLHAMKPFVDESNHQGIDRAIEMLMMLQSARSIQSELETYRAANVESRKDSPRRHEDGTIHEDGIYDLDRVCLSRKSNPSLLPGLFLLMAMSR